MHISLRYRCAFLDIRVASIYLVRARARVSRCSIRRWPKIFAGSSIRYITADGVWRRGGPTKEINICLPAPFSALTQRRNHPISSFLDTSETPPDQGRRERERESGYSAHFAKFIGIIYTRNLKQNFLITLSHNSLAKSIILEHRECDITSSTICRVNRFSAREVRSK